MQEWGTVSVRLNGAARNALRILCKQENITPNEKLRKLIEKEIEPILDPAVLPQNKGFPAIGENHFLYDPEKDSYIWQIDLGVNGIVVMAENVSLSFLEKLSKAIEDGIKQKEEIDTQIKKQKTRVPKGILKYKVK